MRLLKCILIAALLIGKSVAYAQEDNVMYVHYINVGQAAAVLLEFPCGAILIDAGAQDDEYDKKLIAYLSKFFTRRVDLNNTLALVMVTHPHIDHNEALDKVAQKFRVDRYIDDGLRVGSGRVNQKWLQDSAASAGIKYESFSFEDITKGGNNHGITDRIIDPVNCPNGDPEIKLYASRYDKKPEDWGKGDFENYNDHSLVVTVRFGKASFLFTGDLETKGIASLLEEYQHTKDLDVDVLMVGHHGAGNATTDDFLDMTSPLYAVISCGEWDYGKDMSNNFTTYAYGHPRISTINMLASHIATKRSTPIRVQAAEGSKSFRPIDITQAIYATPWDNTIIFRATTSGSYRITTDN